MATHPWVDSVGHTLEQLIAELVPSGPRRLLGVAGPPGAGKTTTATYIAGLAPESSAIVPVDGFHLSNRQLRRIELLDRKGAPETFDVSGLVTLLQRLRTARGEVYIPGFDHVIDEPIAAEHVVATEASLVVVEGSYLLLEQGPWAQVRSLLDAVVFVDEPWSVARPRLVARQMAKGKERERAEAWVDRSDRANFDIVVSTRERANVVVTAPPGE
jgi:pantothenate kinase